MAHVIFALSLLGLARAQQAGTEKPEVRPAFPISQCTLQSGCKGEKTDITADAMWRWLHDASPGGYKNCYKGTQWDATYCPDPKTCAANCAVDGMNIHGYQHLCGINPIDNGVMLKFKTPTGSIGSRVYIIEKSDTFKLFKLKNRELTFDVDVSTLPCGTNGALYLVEMRADGGYGVGNNKAGAKYGTGYCDAQCPKDIKLIEGEANSADWNGWSGHYGTCCTELDLWEANKAVSAFTLHPCSIEGPHRCDGIDCGDPGKGEKYKGVCDRDGCDFNTYRMGNQSFYGVGSGFAVDTTKPITVVTQFITTDGTDTGDLSEIRRLYVQDGKVIVNPDAKILHDTSAVDSVKNSNDTDDNDNVTKNTTNSTTKNATGPTSKNVTDATSTEFTSITNEYCKKEKEVFSKLHNFDAFTQKGGMKQMGEALDRGMVLAMSVNSADQWLDSADPVNVKVTPGVVRGPCPKEKEKRDEIRSKHPDAFVKFTNVKYGEIGSTLDTAGFCCFPKNTKGNVCSTCWSTRAKPSNFCAKSAEHCRSCKGATWCSDYSKTSIGDKKEIETAVLKKFSDRAEPLTGATTVAVGPWTMFTLVTMVVAALLQAFVLAHRRFGGGTRPNDDTASRLPMLNRVEQPAVQKPKPTPMDVWVEA